MQVNDTMCVSITETQLLLFTRQKFNDPLVVLQWVAVELFEVVTCLKAQLLDAANMEMGLSSTVNI